MNASTEMTQKVQDARSRLTPLANFGSGLFSIREATAMPSTITQADSGCTILDRCDQCGRRVLRPHVANGRAYCGDCCPTCARRSK
jgi:hypothetical protein